MNDNKDDIDQEEDGAAAGAKPKPAKARKSENEQSLEVKGHAAERWVSIAVAVWVVVLISYLILAERDYDPTSVYFLKILLSFSMAILVATAPGFINLAFNIPGLALRAGGAIAIFIFVFTQSPAVPQLGLTDPKIEMGSISAVDFRALTDPALPDFGSSPVAITAPIQLKNVKDGSRTGTLQGSRLTLALAGLHGQPTYQSYYFVMLLPGVAGTWLSSGQIRQAKAVDLKPGEVFSEEVMHLSQSGPSWSEFLDALSAATEPVVVDVETDVDGGPLSARCTFSPTPYSRAIAALTQDAGRLPGYVSVQCES